MPYEKKREARKLKERGLSYTQIGKELGISPSEVFRRLYGYGDSGVGPHRLTKGARA